MNAPTRSISRTRASSGIRPTPTSGSTCSWPLAVRPPTGTPSGVNAGLSTSAGSLFGDLFRVRVLLGLGTGLDEATRDGLLGQRHDGRGSQLQADRALVDRIHRAVKPADGDDPVSDAQRVNELTLVARPPLLGANQHEIEQHTDDEQGQQTEQASPTGLLRKDDGHDAFDLDYRLQYVEARGRGVRAGCLP